MILKRLNPKRFRLWVFRVLGCGVGGFRVEGFRVFRVLGYLNPKSMSNNDPKPIITVIKAIILHTFWGPGSQ